uniref:Uncharacterized protein n=1 Tax=Anguilla anguilla TaxID=7936 RepID=A0A0E9X9F8_ANGAN
MCTMKTQEDMHDSFTIESAFRIKSKAVKLHSRPLTASPISTRYFSPQMFLTKDNLTTSRMNMLWNRQLFQWVLHFKQGEREA